MSGDEQKSGRCEAGAWFGEAPKRKIPTINFPDDRPASRAKSSARRDEGAMSMRERATQALRLSDEVWASDSPGPREIDTIAAGLTYNPRARRVGNRIEVLGSREDPKRIAWGFWGGVLMVALVAYLIFVRGSAGLHSMAELLLFSVALIVGMVLFRLGRRSSLREEVLLEVDLEDGHFNWPTASGTLLDLKSQEISEVGYGMVDFSVSQTRNAAPIQAFSVFLRDRTGAHHGVIEASPDKEGALAVAELLAKMLQLPVTYSGAGAVD